MCGGLVVLARLRSIVNALYDTRETGTNPRRGSRGRWYN